MNATRWILAHEEIMWDYGMEEENTSNTSVVLAKPLKDSFHPDFVMFDCASGTNLCKNKEYAQNGRPCKTGQITGIDSNS